MSSKEEAAPNPSEKDAPIQPASDQSPEGNNANLNASNQEEPTGRRERSRTGRHRRLRERGRSEAGRNKGTKKGTHRRRRGGITGGISRRHGRPTLTQRENEVLGKVREQMEAMQQDLSVASQVQSHLLPKKIPTITDYDLGCYYRPTHEVGGDYYDFIRINDKRLGLIVADVSGKGVAGSMVMSMFRSILRLNAPEFRRASATLIRTNKMTCNDIKRGMFVTCFYVILNIEKNALRVCSAGHNPLILWRDTNKKCHLVNPNGIAIGFDEGPVFDKTIKEQMFPLQPGDRILIYTDGVVEAMNEKNEQFGEKRLCELVKRHTSESSGRFVNLVMEAVDAFTGDAPQSDDITLVTLRYDPNPEDQAEGRGIIPKDVN